MATVWRMIDLGFIPFGLLYAATFIGGSEKFFLPCRILEAKSYNAAIRQGQFRPFESPEIIICSYQFAKSKAADVHALPLDLVVIDEAHRLRNVYPSPSKIWPFGFSFVVAHALSVNFAII